MAPPARASFVARCRKDTRVLGQLCLLGLGHAQEPSSRGRVAFATVVVLELLSTSPSCAEAELLLLLPHVFRLIAPHMPPHAQVAPYLPCISPASPLYLPCISRVSPVYLQVLLEHGVRHISPASTLYLPCIYPISPVYLQVLLEHGVRQRLSDADALAYWHVPRTTADRAAWVCFQLRCSRYVPGLLLSTK